MQFGQPNVVKLVHNPIVNRLAGACCQTTYHLIRDGDLRHAV
jgi:hypothetical protein